MNTISKGIWPTMITPFREDGGVDEAAVKAMVDWYIRKGCDGVFAVCQSSEMFYLSLDERARLAKTVMKAAGGRIDIIASGHISEGIGDQISELRAMSDTGVKAVVLVTNRLAGMGDDDEVWIRNADKVANALPDVTFGLYECPYPYKRLLTQRTLSWCAASGRFTFLKDTCCDAAQIREKLNWIREAAARAGVRPMGLYNANSATLLESLMDGADGFSGTMANLHPELYVWLWRHFRTEPEKAAKLQALLTLLSTLEGQGYPVCAKQHFVEEGVPMTLLARSMDAAAFGYAQRYFLKQAMVAEKAARSWLAIE